MTTEDKKLLLKDLCGRLPYGIKVRYSSYEKFITCTLHAINPVYHIVDLWSKNGCFNPVDISKIKPYLFPLSSMTEEQKKEYEDALVYHDYVNGGWTMVKTFDDEYDVPYWFVDFCNENHLDYRGLIPMGLAIDATGKNIY